MKRLLCLAILLLPALARAEWDPAAKDSARALIESNTLIASAIHRAVDNMDLVPASEFPEWHGLIDDLLRAHHAQFHGLQWLSDNNGLDFTSGGNNILQTETRQQVIARGLDRIADADANYSNAFAHMDALEGATVIQSHLNVVRSLTESAQAQLALFDPTLDYTEPRLQANLDFISRVAPADWPTREKSSTAGPHGDYRTVGTMLKNAEQYGVFLAIRKLSDATLEGGNLFRFSTTAGSFRRIMQNIAKAQGLLVGVEHPSLVPIIDCAFGGGSTDRGREFFQIATLEALMLDRTPNTGSETFAGFGCDGPPGLVNSWYKIGLIFRDYLNDVGQELDAAGFGWIGTLAKTIDHRDDGWRATDDVGWETISFPFFANVGPPPQVNITCGPGTVLDSNNECVPDGSGGFVCDPDTTVEIDGTCFGTLTCPEQQVQFLGIDAAGQVSAECVEAP